MDAIFPHGFWRTDFRRPDRHWGPLQCNSRSRPQHNTPVSASTHKQEGPAPSFQITVANEDLETPKSTVEFEFEEGDIEFHEIIIVMEKLSSPINSLMFLQRNHTVLDIINFPCFSMKRLTTSTQTSWNPCLAHAVFTIQSQIYPENAVTGILQPSDLLHEQGDVTFWAAIVTLNKGTMGIHVNNFTDQPCKLKKRLHMANFSVMTPEQMKHVGPIDPVSTWHLLNDNEEDAVHYFSSLPKANRKIDQNKQYWFTTPKNPGDETPHTPIQKRTLRELRSLPEAEKLNPNHERISSQILQQLWLERLNATTALDQKHRSPAGRISRHLRTTLVWHWHKRGIYCQLLIHQHTAKACQPQLT